MSEQHPFHKLSALIDKFNLEREYLDLKGLQDLREDLSLTLFYFSDSAAQSIANYESKDFQRKRMYAELEESYRAEVDIRTGKRYSVEDAKRLARLKCKEIDDKTSEALRQKERVRIIINAVNQILNSLSGRITQLNK